MLWPSKTIAWPCSAFRRASSVAIAPWYGGLVKGLLYEAGEFLEGASYKHVNRWMDAFSARPAVQRGRKVNRAWGEPSGQLLERHDAADFETRTQDKLQAQAG